VRGLLAQGARWSGPDGKVYVLWNDRLRQCAIVCRNGSKRRKAMTDTCPYRLVRESVGRSK
jgi:hypothetical protein